MKITNIVLNGSQGRMGKTIKEVFSEDSNRFNLIEVDPKNELGYKNIAEVEEDFSLIIDFTLPEFSLIALEIGIKKKAGFISGTTGFTKEEFSKIKDAAKEIPVFYASNFSVGIHLMKQVLKLLIPQTVKDYDIEMTEMHHNKKKDAPSGTAISIKETILEAGNLTEENVIYGRQGIIGERPKKEVAIHTLRGGTVFGDHSVIMAGNGEILEIKHRAVSREVFASGVLKAVKFMIGREAGVYSIENLVNQVTRS